LRPASVTVGVVLLSCGSMPAQDVKYTYPTGADTNLLKNYPPPAQQRAPK
jgi:hypothetical protein